MKDLFVSWKAKRAGRHVCQKCGHVQNIGSRQIKRAKKFRRKIRCERCGGIFYE